VRFVFKNCKYITFWKEIIIIDDTDDFLLEQIPLLIQTAYEKGISIPDKELAIQLLS